MRTAVDSNVLLDVFLPDPAHEARSVAALERASAMGSLVICEIVLAEAGGQFDTLDAARAALARGGVEIAATTPESAYAAGRAWRAYRRRGGKRERLVADFLVGAHALLQADALLTRDRGYYASYFPKLKIVTP